MKYINPLSFLSTDPSDTLVLDKKNLLLQKKKLLAEIELSDDKTVIVEGAVLTKNDVLQLFDRLQESEELTYHAAIAQDETLTYFLDVGEMPEDGRFAKNILYNDPAFIRFIAPYYEEVFTKKVLECFKDFDVNPMRDLFANPVLLDGQHMENSYVRINRYLLQKKSYLLQTKETSIENKKASFDDLMPYMDAAFISLLNLLPDEFHEFRNDYAIALINTAIAFQKINLKLGVSILASVRSMDCDEYVQQQNEERYEILSTNLNAKGSGYFSGWRVFFLIFMGLRIMYSIGTCNSDSHNSSYDNYSNYSSPPVEAETFNTNIGQNSSYSASTNFISQLTKFLTDANNRKRQDAEKQTLIESGTDLYKKSLFNTRMYNPDEVPVEERKNNTTVDSLLGVSRGTTEKPAITNTSVNTDEVQLENESDVEAIAIVQTPNSSFSCYVKPNDKVSFFIPGGLSVVYFYLGTKWDEKKEIVTSIQNPDNFSKPLKIKGIFSNLTPSTFNYLHQPFLINVDNTISSTQDHKSFFTIQRGGTGYEQKIFFETLSSQRITMEKGVLN